MSLSISKVHLKYDCKSRLDMYACMYVCMKAHDIILFHLGNEVLHEVVKEDTTTELWLKVRSLYMTKSLMLVFEETVIHSPNEKNIHLTKISLVSLIKLWIRGRLMLELMMKTKVSQS